MRHWIGCILGVLLVAIGTGAAEARRTGKAAVKRPSHNQQARSLIDGINRDTRAYQPVSFVETFCDHFAVPLSVVEELYDKRKSTGEITLLLAMAQALSRRDRVHFATTSDALGEILRLRQKAKSWAGLARAAGLRMNEVLAAARLSHKDIHRHAVLDNAHR